MLPLLRRSAAARIVNVSSILASLTLHAKPGSNTWNTKTFAYNSSKAALNAFTIHLAHELKDTAITVNSIHPGWVKTDMGGADATMSLTDGAKSTVAAALDESGVVNGSYHSLHQTLPW
jgi:NAD(P)-dependent dehydrogenase (short-subunit alcohol dehydrogenase family)